MFDMEGNVLEWCFGPYEPYPVAPQPSRTDGVTPDDRKVSERQFVLRGGSFFHGPPYCRIAYRNRYQPKIELANAGFRVARTITKP